MLQNYSNLLVEPHKAEKEAFKLLFS